MRQEIKDRIKKIRKGEVPKGYKKSEVGVIPLNWGTTTLKKLIKSLDSGVSVNSDDIPCDQASFGILKTSCVNSGKFYSCENKRIIEVDVKRAKLNPQKGSLLISRMNTPELVGEIGYVDKNYSNLFVPDRLWQATLFKDIEAKWLSASLVTSRFRNQIKTIATGTSNSMKNISKDNFLSIRIEYPSFLEQQKIAKVLSTWDKAIELKEQLIKRKIEQKRGLMKALLTGEVRLPGFEGEWKEVRLGEVVEFKNGKAHEKSIDESGRYIVVNSKFISSDGKEFKCSNKELSPLLKGDITMVMSDVPNGKALAKCFMIDEDNKYTLNQRICSLRATKVNNLFLYYTINRADYFIQFDNGVGQTNLRKEEVLSCPLNLPGTTEQVAIAQMINTSNNEINLLELELEQLKIQKKGLMQLLLTGVVRVPN